MGVTQRARGSLRRHVPTAEALRRSAIDAPTVRENLLPLEVTGPQVADDTLVQRVLDLALRIGEVQLATGAGAAVAHDTMLAIARSYGLPVCDVDIAFSTITMCCHRGVETGPVTTMRNVRYRTQDYTRLAQIDELIKSIVDTTSPITVDEAFARLGGAVDAGHPYPRFVSGLARSAFAAAVSVLLGGGVGVAAVTFVLTALVWGAARWLARRDVPMFFQQAFGATVVTTSAVLLAAARVVVGSAPLVIAAGLVVLLSGMSLVGLVQDAITGFPLTSAGRLVEVALATAGLLVGVVVSIKVIGAIGGATPLSYASTVPTLVPAPNVLQIGAAAAAGVFFALSAYAPLSSLPWAALAGAVTWGAYGSFFVLGLGDVVAAALAAGALGLVAMLLPRRAGLPPLVLVVAGITPLLPGLTLYRGFASVANDAITLGAVSIVLALAISLGLAAGVSFGEQIGWPVQKLVRRRVDRARRDGVEDDRGTGWAGVDRRRPRIF